MELGDVGNVGNGMEPEEDDIDGHNAWGGVSSVLMSLRSLKGKDLVDKISLQFGSVQNICVRLGSSPETGLSKNVSNIENRRLHLGSNYVHPKPQKHFFVYIIQALNDVTLITLTVAAVVSLLLSFVGTYRDEKNYDPTKGLEWIEGMTILVAVVLIILVTAFNNWTKERQFRNLKKIVSDQQKFATIRSGELLQINISDIVVGDVCQIKYGDCIPADGLIIQSNDLKVDESSMTGESDPVKKGVKDDPLLLSGSHVLEGSGKMVVTGVGIGTEFGRIVHALSGNRSATKLASSADEIEIKSYETSSNNSDDDYDVKSVLKKKVDKLSIQIGYFGVVMAISTLTILVVRFSAEKFIIEKLPWDRDYIHDFVGFVLIAITILVIAIPEGLPLAVLLSLAIAVKRMMKDKNLVRHLDACETIGNATCICSDKTGTLTTNIMTVVTCHIDSDTYKLSDHFTDLPDACKYHLALSIAVNTSYSTNIVNPKQLKKSTGNKTDCALLGFLLELGLDYDSIRKQHPESKFIKVYTFNSARKWMATVVRCASNTGEATNGLKLLVKGASEIVLQKCEQFVAKDGQIVPLPTGMKKMLNTKVIDVMASAGQRTLCIAYRDFFIEDADEINWDDEEAIVSQLTLLCVVGIEDPVRPEVPSAISKCRTAGITMRMVTGDNIKTARAVALRCGILDAGDENDDQVIMESHLFNARITSLSKNGLVDQELMDQVWPRLRVLARSTPTDKYNLVKGIMDSKLTKDQEIVAVTGDGTNDGPALKKAHVGFAMGVTGTDVAKEASDIILMDDNFTSIVKAVVWGRHVYDSIAKFLQFQLTVNVVAVFTAFISACFVADTPIKAVQMIWINLIQDTLASLSLATEYPNEKLLKRKPYGRNRSILSSDLIINIAIHSLYQFAILLSVLFRGDELLGIKSGEDEDIRGVPNQHFTFIFNVLVLMSLFNEINCRKIDGTFNVFEGIQHSIMFMSLWTATLFLQVIIVEFGGYAFFTCGLTLEQWMWCIFLGISELLLGLLVNIINYEIKLRSSTTEEAHYVNLDKENDVLIDVNQGNIKYTQTDGYIIRF